MTNPGDWLRGLREELHLTRVTVERFTSERRAEPTMSAVGFDGDGSRRLKNARLCRCGSISQSLTGELASINQRVGSLASVRAWNMRCGGAPM
jgi:hypothetical protein